MGILSPFRVVAGLRQSSLMAPAASPWRDDDVLTRLTLGELFGTETMPVGRREAMSVPVIARARNLICQQIARFPLQVTKTGIPIPGQPGWVSQIEAGRPRPITLAWIVDALLFHGRAFLEITERYATGYPSRFAWVPEWQARTDGAGTLLAVDSRRVKPGEWIRVDAPTRASCTLRRRTFGTRLR
ncbi:hypothetical protein [Leifsonia xyli]|uniref:hypothetical protein n=1 Tax=Leifsonia xyli TaxID=1575 RepID=UPI001F15E02E|nr:hypothetical protein [Leifsonia xyli]